MPMMVEVSTGGQWEGHNICHQGEHLPNDCMSVSADASGQNLHALIDPLFAMTLWHKVVLPYRINHIVLHQ